MKRATYFVLFAALAALLLATPSFADSRDWTLSDIDGQDFKLSENLGKPTLLVFWATWCVPCKKEMDERTPLFREYEEKGVNVVLISVDLPKTQARVKPYIESKGYTWRVLMDPTQEVLKRYGGINVPYTVLLDSSGKDVYTIKTAIKDTSKLTQMVDQTLGAAGE